MRDEALFRDEGIFREEKEKELIFKQFLNNRITRKKGEEILGLEQICDKNSLVAIRNGNFYCQVSMTKKIECRHQSEQPNKKGDYTCSKFQDYQIHKEGKSKISN